MQPHSLHWDQVLSCDSGLDHGRESQALLLPQGTLGGWAASVPGSRELPRPWQSLLWAGSLLLVSVSLLTDPPWASVSPSVEGHLGCPRGPVTVGAFLCFSHHLPETPNLTQSSSHSLGRFLAPCLPGWAMPVSSRQLSICTCNGGEARRGILPAGRALGPEETQKHRGGRERRQRECAADAALWGRVSPDLSVPVASAQWLLPTACGFSTGHKHPLCTVPCARQGGLLRWSSSLFMARLRPPQLGKLPSGL